MLEILVLSAGAILVTLSVALLLVISQSPQYLSPKTGQGLDFSEAMGGYSDLSQPLALKARGGAHLTYRRYDSPAPATTILVLIHGSAWHGMQFHKMAKAIAAQGLWVPR